MFVYVKTSSKKKKKPTAKQKQLRADWEILLKKYEPKKPVPPRKDDGLSYSLGKPARRETPNIPSLPFTGGPCIKKENHVYTGTAMKGIGTMHKSNAIPIFTEEHAVEIATMRRG
jgi:hypothetical protein